MLISHALQKRMQSSMGHKIMSQKEKDGYKKIRSGIGGQSKEEYYTHFEEIEIYKTWHLKTLKDWLRLL